MYIFLTVLFFITLFFFARDIVYFIVAIAKNKGKVNPVALSTELCYIVYYIMFIYGD